MYATYRHLGAMPHVDVPAYSGALAAQLTHPYPWIWRARSISTGKS